MARGPLDAFIRVFLRFAWSDPAFDRTAEMIIFWRSRSSCDVAGPAASLADFGQGCFDGLALGLREANWLASRAVSFARFAIWISFDERFAALIVLAVNS